MELALNLAWFVLVVASYGLLVRHFARRRIECAGRPSRCQCVVALGCALAILFPVISLTDDLHEMQAAIEESLSSASIMKKCGVNHQLAPVGASHQLVYVVSSFRAAIGWIAFGRTATQDRVLQSSAPRLTTFGRAPPSFNGTTASFQL
jgi:hypothetical protein